MLNFLKKLFSTKEPAVNEEITLSNLPAWFDEKTRSVHAGLGSAVSENYSKIKELIQQLNTAVTILENAEIKDPDKVEQRIKVTVLGNRDSYTKNMTLFAKNFKIPENNEYKQALEFCTMSQLSLDNLSRNTVKSYHTAQHLFFDQVEAIAKIIKEIDSAIKSLKTDIDNSNAELVDNTKEKIKNVLDQKESQEILKEELAKQITRKATLEKQQVEAEKKIKEFEESKEYKGFKLLIEDDDKVSADIKIIKTEVLNLFSSLETAFRKFARITTMHEELVEQYAEDPINAFLNDKQLNILIILQNLKKNIEANSVELKEKKREKSLQRIQEIDREKLNFINSKLEALKLKRKKFSDAIMSNDVLRNKRVLLDDLNRIKKEFQEAEKSISDLEKRDMFSIEEMTQEIKKDILKVLNINLSFSQAREEETSTPQG